MDKLIKKSADLEAETPVPESDSEGASVTLDTEAEMGSKSFYIFSHFLIPLYRAYQSTRNRVFAKNSVSLFSQQHQDLILGGEGCYNHAFGCEICYKDINLTPNAELREVDSRLNREADTGD